MRRTISRPMLALSNATAREWNDLCAPTPYTKSFVSNAVDEEDHSDQPSDAMGSAIVEQKRA